MQEKLIKFTVIFVSIIPLKLVFGILELNCFLFFTSIYAYLLGNILNYIRYNKPFPSRRNIFKWIIFLLIFNLISLDLLDIIKYNINLYSFCNIDIILDFFYFTFVYIKIIISSELPYSPLIYLKEDIETTRKKNGLSSARSKHWYDMIKSSTNWPDQRYYIKRLIDEQMYKRTLIRAIDLEAGTTRGWAHHARSLPHRFLCHLVNHIRKNR